MIYIIGSLRNPQIPIIAKQFRDAGIEVFADWYAAGERADDAWKEYEQGQGFSYTQALQRPAAKNVFEFDKRHLDEAEAVVLVLPAGRSGHLELGYCIGQGKRGYILLDSPDRWDVMYQFATGVFTNIEELIHVINTSTGKLGEVCTPLVGVCPDCNQYPGRCCCTVHQRDYWGV